MITKEEYKKALEIIDQYETQEFERLENMMDSINLRLMEFFKATYVKDFYLYQDDGEIHIISKNPQFDEDYNGHFDKDMKKISQELGVTILFEPHNYGK